MQVYNLLAMEFRKFFAKRLKDARVEKGLTQVKLAELSGVHGKAIAKYEGAVIIPTVETLKKLAEALEVSADYFVFDYAQMDGIPRIQDADLYERYFLLEQLSENDRASAMNVIDALIARNRLQEIAAGSKRSASVQAK